MAVIGKMRAGKGARVSVGATSLKHAEFDITVRGDDLDTTNFESAGLDQGTIGILSGDFNTGGDWDAGRNAFDSPPGFYPRDDLADLRFFGSLADNVGWILPIARVLSAKNGAQVRQKVSFQATGKSNGGLFMPTGSV